MLVAGVSGPVERVWLERSYHVATLDHDASEVQTRTVAFVSQVLGAPVPGGAAAAAGSGS
ncbi:MAG: hypothetical protein ACYDB3_11465, partial [Acidimicrobiales bacterium]